jgi:NAD(P)-dependent dehydrogenase (short-subunit alcohol dehydrogenase family)
MTGVLVTGGADGIGWAIARSFAARGDRVAILDLDGARAAERAAALGPGHLGLGGDVTDEGQVEAAVARAVAAFGGLGAAVNNAGIGDNPAPTLEQDLDRFRRVLAVHVDGAFLVSRAAARAMMPAGGGAIVNIASIAGLGGIPRRNAYGAAKAGIVAMTRAMACEWAGAGIRVNAVAPGYVATELLAKLEAEGGVDLAAIRRRIPMGRLGEPEAIADAVVFLASPAARYVTGTVLPVDGGWSAFGGFGDASHPEGATT